MLIRYARRPELLLVLSLFCLGACEMVPEYDPNEGRSVSIPYDPYNFDPQDLDAEAQAHCDAFGLRAQYEDETVDNQSVRWRYRHYICV